MSDDLLFGIEEGDPPGHPCPGLGLSQVVVRLKAVAALPQIGQGVEVYFVGGMVQSAFQGQGIVAQVGP